ncbi:glutaminase [Euzebya sp.]|uniref:glutaminase n=1 Tax=Euzebya sp. TaxID=1971409 RepID=UPI0035128C6B
MDIDLADLRAHPSSDVFEEVLAEVADDVRELVGVGEVADYIPALARVPADRFGMAVADLHGDLHTVGEADRPFSIQSISKVFSLILATQRFEGDLWDRVGREPSGDPFNSLVQLEHECGVPRNPFINAGAIVIADVLSSCLADPLGELVALVSELAGAEIPIDGEVARSEASTGYRNRSLANLMKAFGNIQGEPDDVLDIYFAQCALTMSARQLATALRFLANDGVDPASGHRVLDVEKARRINALMLTCGTYDAAGEFAFRVGIPCKSGVGGGIVGVIPHHLTACAWSPALDRTGNSVAGRAAIEQLVERTGLSVF